MHLTAPAIATLRQFSGCARLTVNKHLAHIFAKLDVETRPAVAVLASNVHSPQLHGSNLLQ